MIKDLTPKVVSQFAAESILREETTGAKAPKQREPEERAQKAGTVGGKERCQMGPKR